MIPDAADAGDASRLHAFATGTACTACTAREADCTACTACTTCADCTARTACTAGYPALVAFKPKDNRFSVSKAAFEVAHVSEFVESIRRGGEPVLAIQVMIHIPWHIPFTGHEFIV